VLRHEGMLTAARDAHSRGEEGHDA
jgi:hypothetical protein